MNYIAAYEPIARSELRANMTYLAQHAMIALALGRVEEFDVSYLQFNHYEKELNGERLTTEDYHQLSTLEHRARLAEMKLPAYCGTCDTQFADGWKYDTHMVYVPSSIGVFGYAEGEYECPHEEINF